MFAPTHALNFIRRTRPKFKEASLLNPLNYRMCKLHSSRMDFPRISSNNARRELRYFSKETTLNVFDRKAKRVHREWSASLQDGNIYNVLKDEIGDRVADRVYDIIRKFSVCVELGCGRGHVTKHLNSEKVDVIYQCDMSQGMVEISEVSEDIPTFKMVVDEEFLPFSNNSIDLFLSSLSFHWINDLPGVLQQILSSLKPDGALIASMFGGMSESNVAWNRKLHINRDSLLAAAALYMENFGNADGTVPATFQIIYLLGWKPDKSQPKPAKRGSGKISMKTISNIDTKEI
ncbi:arginine-hydroxylase NDUFAF5, mitochondrial-like isoform X2 [Stegodyphus dumicola]|uniref:arginine-hydroxylase NDUFAF5, mitochondrial-like isoform X2 n=1 Tax=Stegodyphus dumicola TaxID=202533 RepID=UPI0015A9777C|nr:arginine-hydroxylase NDUFAF5, mitochondrial-like isoform X2 [Stegodyphus dumicola]